MENQQGNTVKNPMAEKLSAVGWGAFFVWIGIAWLLNVGTGIGLLGVGIITLAMQMVRKSFNLPLEGGWVVVGVIMVLSALSELIQVEMNIVPILIIIAGVALLIPILKGKK